MTALLSRKQIAASFNPHPDTNPEYCPRLTADQINRLRCVQIKGAQHGKLGWYSDSAFGSDADFCYGVGAEIKALETELGIDDDAVFELYTNAHSAFFRDGTINPSDRDYCGCGSEAGVYTLSFGAYGGTMISVHAGCLEDALELAADHLHDIAPGHFMSDDEMLDALVDACKENDITLERFRELESADSDGPLTGAEYTLINTVRQAAEADLTYTESGWLRSYEWTVDGPE